jgi:hypothetical protein
MESTMTENIEKSTGEIEALAVELAELAKEGREAEIAWRLSETKARWDEEALRDHELAEEAASTPRDTLTLWPMVTPEAVIVTLVRRKLASATRPITQ